MAVKKLEKTVLNIVEKRLKNASHKLDYAWNGEEGKDISPLKHMYADACIHAAKEAIGEINWALRTLERLRKINLRRESS